MKTIAGIFCAGFLILSLSGCSSTSDRVAETETQPATIVEIESAESNSVFADMAKKALMDYFGVDMADTSGYSVIVQYMGAIPEFDVEQQISVIFLPDELNFEEESEEAIIDMETIETKPKYDVTFTAEGAVKEVHISYAKWGKSAQPATAESAKEIAKDFVVSHQLAEEGSLKILGSTVTSTDTITVVLQHKEGYTLLVGVDSSSGRVKFFEFIHKNG